MKKVLLPVRRVAQNPLECGPACVKAILDGMLPEPVSLSQLEREISPPGAGKYWEWDLKMGQAALSRGVPATVFTHDTILFDPTWFNLPKELLLRKLDSSAKALVAKGGTDWWTRNRITAVREAANFLRNGGRIEFLRPNARFKAVSPRLLRAQLDIGRPVIVPIDTSRFYGRPRRLDLKSSSHDDLTGRPFGHVLAIRGYDKDRFHIMDPGRGIFRSAHQEHLIGSINHPQVLAIGPTRARRRARKGF